MYDLLIRKATMYDGTGGLPHRADVAIQGEQITEIVPEAEGAIPAESAHKCLLAEGLCLAPGFIDVHSHSDHHVLICPTAESKIHQGVTTEVFGNCGASAFPITEKNRREHADELKHLGLPLVWNDIGGYRKRVEETGITINAATLVGHTTVRSAIMGYDDRPPTQDELAAMRREVEKAVDAGALGLSSGLQYPPGRFASSQEVIELAKGARTQGGIYTTHMRCEGDELIESVEESLEIARQADLPMIISHLKASGRPNWGKAGLAITLIEIARRQGLRVVFDRYPYLASSTNLDVFMPAWAQAGGRERLLERLQTGDENLIAEYRSVVERLSGWENILITSILSDHAENLVGKSVAQIARERSQEPWRTAVDLLIESGCRVDMCNFSMCQEDTDRVLAHPCCMIGSDASIASRRGVLGRRKPHPRAYGTFPRFLGTYVRDRKITTLEDAVRRMSHLPAETLGLQRRGKIAEGYFADLVLFNLDKVQDLSRFGDPHHFPSGIVHVIVNGRLVVENGRLTDARPGRFLTREGGG